MGVFLLCWVVCIVHNGSAVSGALAHGNYGVVRTMKSEAAIAVLCKVGLIGICVGVLLLMIGAGVMWASCDMPLETRDDGKRAKGVLCISGKMLFAGFASMIVGAIIFAIG